MVLLIDKKCLHCLEVEKQAEQYGQIIKLYVYSNMVELEDGKQIPLDEKIPALPALIHENMVYVGEKYISDFLKTLEEKI